MTEWCQETTSECADVTSWCAEVMSWYSETTSWCTDATSECAEMTEWRAEAASWCAEFTPECVETACALARAGKQPPQGLEISGFPIPCEEIVWAIARFQKRDAVITSPSRTRPVTLVREMGRQE